LSGLSARVSRGAGAGGMLLDDEAPAPARLLSVVELQGALRAARTGSLVTVPRRSPRSPQPPTPAAGRLGPWVAVLGAHGGAGASTVALALADAAAVYGKAVRLVGYAVPARSGLVAVTTVELGVSDQGLWRSGRRGPHLTVDLFTGSSQHTASRPTLEPHEATGWSTVVDVDVQVDVQVDDGAEWQQALLSQACAVVLVFRVTVPGVRQAERLLTELAQTVDQDSRPRLVLGAAVGPTGWPGAVASSAGPLLRRCRSEGHLVRFPVDPRLELSGLTNSALPKAVLRAGKVLHAQLDQALPAARPVAAAVHGSAPTQVVRLGTTDLPGALPKGLLAKENCA
jgi:hypothetical protein